MGRVVSLTHDAWLDTPTPHTHNYRIFRNANYADVTTLFPATGCGSPCTSFPRPFQPAPSYISDANPKIIQAAELVRTFCSSIVLRHFFVFLLLSSINRPNHKTVRVPRLLSIRYAAARRARPTLKRIRHKAAINFFLLLYLYPAPLPAGEEHYRRSLP